MRRNNKENIVKLEVLIKNLKFLVEELDDYFFDDDENKEVITSILLKSKLIGHFETNIGEEAEKTVVLFRFDKSKNDSIKDELVECFKNNLNLSNKKVQLIGVVESLSEKTSLLKLIKSNKKEFLKELKVSATNFDYDVIFLPKVDKKPIELSAIRMNSLIFPEPSINLNVMPPKDCTKTEDIEGFLFVVSLAELVDIYNRVGDELFSSNLRYGIEDKMSLESSMKDTLENEPGMFWFYNNGITIVTEEDSIGLENVGKIVLSNCWDSTNLNFSVINGAQTISTASRIMEGMDKDKKAEIKKSARVLLRIIIAKKKASRRNITIALNRQKPIRPEDIAFQSLFVSTFNEYMNKREKDRKDYLYIIKRGEEVYDDNTIELPLFAQLVYACFMNPTEARNLGPANLYYENKDYEQLKKAYFLEDFSKTASSSVRESIYIKYYQEVLWAFRVYRALNATLKKYTDKYERTILANNRWSFIAYTLKAMHGFSGEMCQVDYSGFQAKDELIKDIKSYMDSFIDVVKCSYGNDYKSDYSKTKEFWDKILKEQVPDIFKKLANTESVGNKEMTKAEFINFLQEMSFEYDDELEEYHGEVDCLAFSDVKISITDNTFDISTTLYDVFYDMDDDDDSDKDKYGRYLEETIDKFTRQMGETPEIIECLGCSDGSAELAYCKVPFDKSYVNKFISVMSEVCPE